MDLYVFSGCDSLQYNIEDNLKYLGNETNPYLYLKAPAVTNISSANINDNCRFIGDYAFSGCSSLKDVTMGENITSIGEMAFHNCDSLTSVTIEDGVTNIGDSAFAYCDSLASIVIPKSVINIEECAFRSCDSLKSITVEEDNDSYKDIDGNLYSKDGTILMQYAIGKTVNTFIIPEGITSIGSYAFYDCDSLVIVTIGNGVENIGDLAFYNCDSLSSIIVPESVTSIGEKAFVYCYELTIYCKAESQPTGWNLSWNYSNLPVEWGYKG